METFRGEGGGGRGGRWRLRHVVPVVLLWMTLHRHVLGCASTNCNLVLTEARGEITSPCYPQRYPNSYNCRWIMQAPTGFIIQLSFLDFELEEAPGCIYDWVKVNTGSAEVVFCGLTANGLTLNSTGNQMVLSFTSDFSVQKKGFRVSFQHVAVALRNQKIKMSSGFGQITKVANSVSIPALSQLTICFEVERTSLKQKEWIFTYSNNSSAMMLSLGSDGTGMKMVVDGVVCPIDNIILPSDFTNSMKSFCVLWTSSNGHVAVYFNGNYWAKACSSSTGHSVQAGGEFRIGSQQQSFDGNIYNLRMWDYAMSIQQLGALKCDHVGNVIDWDNSYWTIPASLAQTNTSLSCSVFPVSNATLNNNCDPSALGCPDEQFYRFEFVVDDSRSQTTRETLKSAVALWLNQTFQDWIHKVYVGNISVQLSPQTAGNLSSYECRGLLVYTEIINENLSLIDDASARLRQGSVSEGVEIQSGSVEVKQIENCPDDPPWPETRPTVTQYQPCFPNKKWRTW